jgi:peptidoglycan/LPS O-acetylase OafA/YrhL
MERPALLELTSTRFFAAFAVLFGHFNEFLHLPGSIPQWFAGGHYVSFFFTLSGFILTYRYWDTFAQGVHRPGFRGYFVARIARIYPSYVLALLLLTAVFITLNALRPGSVTYPGNTVTSWFVNLFALQTFARSYDTQQYWNAPAWSISTEFCFYAMFPFIVAGIARHCRGRAGLIWVAVAATLLGVVAQATTLILVYVYGWDRTFWLDLVASRNIGWRLQQFMMGVVVARLLFGGHLPALGRPAVRNAVLIAGLAVMSAMNVAPWPGGDVAPVVMRQFRLEIGYMFPFAAIIVALAAGRTFLTAFLQTRVMVLLGHGSYGLYIFHWIPWVLVAHAVNRGWRPDPWTITTVILLTILFSVACYIVYETPSRQYLRRTFGQSRQENPTLARGA